MSVGPGYSKRSLAEKLGLMAGLRICLLNSPPGYLEKLGPHPNIIFKEGKSRQATFFYFIPT